jgi:hypothetical protein
MPPVVASPDSGSISYWAFCAWPGIAESAIGWLRPGAPMSWVPVPRHAAVTAVHPDSQGEDGAAGAAPGFLTR